MTKTQSILAAVLAATAMSAHAQQKAPAMPMKDVATDEQLTAKLRASQQADPIAKLEPAKGGDPAKANPVPGLLAGSDILCFGGKATLVPKRAILNQPASLADRVKMQPGAKFQIWPEFITSNRGWITTVEVSRAQAEGREPLSEDTLKSFQDSPNLVVATYQGGPISVLPLKVTPENTPGASNPTSTPSAPKP